MLLASRGPDRLRNRTLSWAHSERHLRRPQTLSRTAALWVPVPYSSSFFDRFSRFDFRQLKCATATQSFDLSARYSTSITTSFSLFFVKRSRMTPLNLSG